MSGPIYLHKIYDSVKVNTVEVLRELSPIIAGAKLAAIILSYIGVGSVAKWVVERWFPFTRWVWERVTEGLSLPSLTQIQKDSLTVLVFFLPLGISALLQMRKGEDHKFVALKTRLVSALFGLACVIIVCYDIIRFILMGGEQ